MSTLIQTSRLVGREIEAEQLSEALERASLGSGSIVLIGGPAGIGKSSLARVLMRRASKRELAVLAGGCYDLTTTPPYGPWIEAMSRRVADTDGLSDFWASHTSGDRQKDQQTVLDGLLGAVRSASQDQPLVLVLEDLHWADQSSLDALRYIGRHVRNLSLVIAATYRDDEISPGHPLYKILPSIVRESDPIRQELRPLSIDSIVDLIAPLRLTDAAATTLTTYLYRRAEGNPLFTHELLRSIAAERLLRETNGGFELGDLAALEVPTLVVQLIERRLSGLDGASRRLIEIAAVIGQEVDLDLWIQVSSASLEQLENTIRRAITLHVLEQVAGCLSFTHALVRETIHDGILLPRRREYHQLVAEALVKNPSVDPDSAAQHFEGAADGRAVDWYVRAAERALNLWAIESAADRLQRARDLAGSSGVAFPPRGYCLRGRVQEMVGNYHAAFADFATFLQLARQDRDLLLECEALLELGGLLASRDYERAGEYFEEALNVARQGEDSLMLARTLNRVGNWLANIERQPESEQRHLEALAIYQNMNDGSGVAATYDLLGASALLGGDMVKSNHYYDQAIPLLRELNDLPLLAQALGGRGHASVGAPTYVLFIDPDRRKGGIAAAAESREVARATGWKALEAYAIAMSTQTLIVRGNYQQALDGSLHALKIVEDIAHDQWICFTRQNLSDVYRDLLMPEIAAAYLEPALEIADRTGSIVWRSWIRSSLALTRLETGDRRAAQALAKRLPDPDRPNISFCRLYELFAHASIAAAAGNLEHALAITGQAIQLDPAGRGAEVPKTLNLRGEILMDLGRLDEAEQTLTKSRELAKARGYRPYEWRALASLGRVHAAMGRKRDASASSQQAGDIIEALAAEVGDAELRVRFLTRTTDQLHSASARHYPNGLTPREVEVLELIAAGRSNRQMAEDLFLSVRTVERHVANIYRKIDVHNRAEATRYAVEHQLVDTPTT